MTIDEIKKAEKEKNEYSSLKLFKAENNLDLHTDFRRNDKNHQNSIDDSKFEALIENSSSSIPT